MAALVLTALSISPVLKDVEQGRLFIVKIYSIHCIFARANSNARSYYFQFICLLTLRGVFTNVEFPSFVL